MLLKPCGIYRHLWQYGHSTEIKYFCVTKVPSALHLVTCPSWVPNCSSLVYLHRADTLATPQKSTACSSFTLTSIYKPAVTHIPSFLFCSMHRTLLSHNLQQPHQTRMKQFVNNNFHVGLEAPSPFLLPIRLMTHDLMSINEIMRSEKWR